MRYIRKHQNRVYQYLIFIIFLWNPSILNAHHLFHADQMRQKVSFERISVENGLSSFHVRNIFQDSEGFIWFTTTNGLNRFDGYGMKIFRHDKKNPFTIGSNNLQGIMEDKSGNLWIGSIGGGLSRFDKKSGKFFNYKHIPQKLTSLSSDNITALYKDGSGALWIGTDDGLNLFDPKQDLFVHYQYNLNLPYSLRSNVILSIFEDHSGVLWVGTRQGGLSRFDRKSEKFSHFLHDPDNKRSLTNDTVTAIYEDSFDNLWIGTEEGLNRLNLESGDFESFKFEKGNPLSLSDNRVTSIYEDAEGRLWIGTVDGLNLFDRKDKHFIRLFYSPNNAFSISGNAINSIYEDNQGIIWFATAEDGVSKFDSGSLKFSGILGQYDIRGIVKSARKVLWLATFNKGLIRYERESGKIRFYRYNPKNGKSISSDQLLTLYSDHRENLWVGTKDRGMSYFDQRKKRFYHFPGDPENRSDGHLSVGAIVEDNNHDIWYGTHGSGLGKLDRKTGRYKTFYYDSEKKSPSRVQAIFIDQNGMVWVGAEDGFYKFDPVNEVFTTYRHQPGKKGSLSNNHIGSIYMDSSGNFWLGTKGGINKFFPKSDFFTSYRDSQLDLNEVISGIVEDKRGNLWLNSKRGLIQFDLQKLTYRHYSSTDGLQRNRNYRLYKSKDGEVFIGGAQGVTFFIPEQLMDNRHVPPVVLTGFQVRNKFSGSGEEKPLYGLIENKREMVLSHDESTFSIGFSALSYRFPEKNKYAYRLRPLENEWIEVGSSGRLVNYSNVPAGEYLFQVKASNNDGLWNEKGFSLKIMIKKPWWESWWFITGLIFSVLCFLFLFFQWRMRFFYAQKMKLQQEVERRTEELEVTKNLAEHANQVKTLFLANFSCELRSPLDNILRHSDFLSQTGEWKLPEEKAIKSLQENGRLLMGLVDDMHDFSNIEKGDIEFHPERVDFYRFLNEIMKEARKMAMKKGLEILFQVPFVLPDFLRVDERRLKQVLLNILENAIKYTEKGGVTFRVKNLSHQQYKMRDNVWKVSDSMIFFEVVDTGIGIANEDLKKIVLPFEQVLRTSEHDYGVGIGLSIANRLITMMGGRLQVRSQPGKGSIFCFKAEFPVAKRLLQEEADRRSVVGYQTESNKKLVIAIIDHDALSRSILINILEPLGFLILEASDGISGVELIKDKKPDLIIADMAIPIMSGPELIREVRRTESISDTPIIAVSTNVLTTNRHEFMVAGCDIFLPKPLAVEKLYTFLEKALSLTWLSDKH